MQGYTKMHRLVSAAGSMWRAHSFGGGLPARLPDLLAVRRGGRADGGACRCVGAPPPGVFLVVLVLYVVIACRFSWFLSLLFIKNFSCFGVLGKASVFLGFVALCASICGNILV